MKCTQNDLFTTKCLTIAGNYSVMLFYISTLNIKDLWLFVCCILREYCLNKSLFINIVCWIIGYFGPLFTEYQEKIIGLLCINYADYLVSCCNRSCPKLSGMGTVAATHSLTLKYGLRIWSYSATDSALRVVISTICFGAER